MNSDKTKTLKQSARQLGRRFTMAVAAVLFATSFANAQDFIFIEGEIHTFNVEYHEGNSFVWSYHDQNFDPMPEESYDFLEGQDTVSVTVQFMDISRVDPQLTYLAVTETRPEGCSTTRAVSILIQPNNMYFDFAVATPDISDDCYTGTEYYAGLEVGMDFNNRIGATAYAPIDSTRFPLKVKYTVRNVTDGLVAVEGNIGEYVVFEYNAENDYALLVPEATGEQARTIEYELAITEVVDKYGTKITHDENRRLQIRIINHLPQTGGMDMVMAYNVTPVQYNGGM